MTMFGFAKNSPKSLATLSVMTACLCTLLIEPARADNSSLKNVPLKGAKFTKVEDLDPNKRSSNRPIKRKWAVVVGLSKFKENRLRSDDGKNSAAAHEFKKYLLDPDGGRFSRKQVRMLTGYKATRENVLNTLGRGWLGQLAGADDLVVVFISTSSFPTTDGGAYLCAYDCALDNVYGTCISMKDLMSTLKKNVQAKRIVLVIQAGYSGAASLSDGAKSLSKPKMNFDPDKLISGSGYVLISSSKPNQMSWGNIFSKNFIKSLKTNNGMIPLEKAFTMAKAQTETDTTQHAGRYKAKQTPVYKSEWKGKDLSIGIPALETIEDLPANVTEFLAAEAYYFKANNLLTQGKVNEAIEEYKLAIKTDPRYASALADYSTVLAIKGKWKEAEQLAGRAINEKPDEALYRKNYARILSKLGKVDESIKQLEIAYNLNSKDKVVLTALAMLMVKKKEYDTAVNLLTRAVKLYPKSSDLHNRLSLAFAKSGDLTNALLHANKAVHYNPKSAPALVNLGTMFLLDGNVQGAQLSYKKAVSLNPKDPNAHYLLSTTYAKTGKSALEKTELQKFVELASPRDPRKAKAELRLSNL